MVEIEFLEEPKHSYLIVGFDFNLSFETTFLKLEILLEY